MNVTVIRDFSKGHAPVDIDDVRTTVISDDFNQPIVICQVLAKGQYLVTKAGDNDFQQILKSLGLNLNTKYVATRSTL